MSLIAGRRMLTIAAEARKIPAFFRRDLFITLSYRMALLSDWFSLVVQMVLFSYVAKMVDPGMVPPVNGVRTGYLEYVTIGIAITGFLQVGLGRVVTTIRGEQLMGTLEMLLLAPMATSTLQLGIVFYDLVYVPVRTTVFLVGISLLFDVKFHMAGILPAIVVLVTFVPFVWGIGVLSAAAVVAFRRGAAVTGFAAVALTLTSGAYFPLALLPSWAQAAAHWNPLTVALDGVRGALLGSTGWAEVMQRVAALLPMATGALFLGFGAFRLALRHERRRGSLGLY